ncbi:MAG: hypothetical protein HY287_18390 [Planctomycetes bacterium]|nr:hypothetical protein [Planctomycetota bacterium]
MRQLLIGLIDALIPLGIAGLLLLFPQWFTKKDLKIEENRNIANRLKTIGWLLLAAGTLTLIVNIASTVTKK